MIPQGLEWSVLGWPGAKRSAVIAQFIKAGFLSNDTMHAPSRARKRAHRRRKASACPQYTLRTSSEATSIRRTTTDTNTTPVEGSERSTGTQQQEPASVLQAPSCVPIEVQFDGVDLGAGRQHPYRAAVDLSAALTPHRAATQW